MTPTLDDALEQVIHAITSLCAEWEIDAPPVRGSTRLAADLNFSSIHTMHLLAKLNLRFGRQLPFDALLLRGGGYAADLTVDELAGFVHRESHRAGAPAHG